MTLFTAEGLLRGQVRGMTKGTSSMASIVSHAYLRWLKTQGETPAITHVAEDGWLYQTPELHHARAPDNNSKGYGGVMRATPVGIYAYLWITQEQPDRIFDLGCEITWITHGHPSGYRSAGCLSTIIAYLLSGEALSDAIEHTISLLKQRPVHTDQLALIEQARHVAQSNSAPVGAPMKHWR